MTDPLMPVQVGPSALRSILKVRHTRDLFFAHLERHGVRRNTYLANALTSGAITLEDLEEPDLWGFR